MFRAARPQDITGLLGLISRQTIDLAYPYKRLGQEPDTPRSVARVVGAASLPRRGATYTFMLTQGGSPGAVVVVRGTKGGSSWEIEHLLVPPGAEEMCAELLTQLDRKLRPRRGTNIFLRLSEDSLLLQAIGRTGFRGYAQEELFVRRAGDRLPREIPSNISVSVQSQPADFQLFRLHTSGTPVAMRIADGLTLREWQDSLATRWIDIRKTTDIVATIDDTQVGWVRFGEAGSNTVIARGVASSEQPDIHEVLIEAVIQSCGASRTIQFLAPSYEGTAARALMTRGFRPEVRYRSFAYQVGQRVLEGALAPVGL